MNMPCSLLLLSILLLGPVDDGAVRVWTDASGKYRIEAAFAGVQDGQVRLKRADGATVAVPLARLSREDRDHVKQLLARDAEPPAEKPAEKPADASKTPTPDEKPSEKPPVAAETPPAKEPVRTGSFSTSFPDHSPLAGFSTVLPRLLRPAEANNVMIALRKQLGPNTKVEYGYKMEDETWQVHVPEDYDGSLPYGLFVFVNSSDSGNPQGGWLPVLREHRMIYAGPDNAGNKKDIALRRTPLALDAVYNLSRQYKIDPDRIYISGNSGGGRLASRAAIAFADVFSGGQYHVGADDHTITGAANSPLLNVARSRGRYVFITGDKDMNQKEMQGIARRMTTSGFRFISYLQIPGHGHSGPPADWFEKGILALDAPLREASKAQYQTARKALGKEQWGLALPALQAAAAHGAGEPFGPEALQKLNEVQARYDTELAALERLLAEGDLKTANKELATFQRRWAKAAAADVQRLRDEIKKARLAR